jgi:hypothetical protein
MSENTLAEIDATTKFRFIEPMYARLVQRATGGEGWHYEIKFAGYCCLAGRDATKVSL